jgi:hypothetical protein
MKLTSFCSRRCDFLEADGNGTLKPGCAACFRVQCRAMDLVELLKRPEGKTLEFKQDLSSPEGVMRTIVAFANTAGGVLLVGVQDKSRNMRGVRTRL